MGYTFKGVNTDRNGTYIYNYEDIPKASVPISEKSVGDFKLSKAELDEWFGISDKSMQDLPTFLICPRLDSSWGGNTWWNINGDMVVCKPKKWVPHICRTKTYPRSAVETIFKETTTKTTTTRLYAKAEASLEASTNSNFWGIKVEAKAKVESSVEGEINTSTVTQLQKEGRLGDKVVHEVWVSMLLEVEEVYSHSLKAWIELSGDVHNVGWHGGPGWDDIFVSSYSMKEVDGFKFHPINMSGSGHSDSIYVATLPVFNGSGENKDIESLHIALSCSGWKDWYAYVPGKQGPSYRTQLMAWPAYGATPTLLAVDSK